MTQDLRISDLKFESPLMVFYVCADMRSRKLHQRNEVLGGFPEFGAIFMSNRSTLQECFEKRLFGLPVGYSDFVRNVKEGMTLFLFEFEERKLYGIFEATSDGGMNIVPQAYVSTGRSFPAQVKFKIKWHCDPLSEDEFYGAIKDNYFGSYKFNFGLTKEQIESLLQLFSSRKIEVPRTPCHKKRKNKKQGYKSIKDVGKKGRFAEVEIFRRKPDKIHGSSDISELDVETFLASIACGKSEVTHSDDAYDPENPGFHHSVVPKDLNAAFGESHELVALQSKKENFNFSAEDTLEYIPLCLPDSADEEGFDVGECTGEELGKFVDNKLSIIPVPQLPLVSNLSDEGCNQKKMEDSVTSSNGSPCSGLDNSSLAAISFSDAVGFQSKPGSNRCELQPAKCLYSDNLKKRASVFSRLTFPSKNQNDLRMKLVDHKLRVKQHS
ncbi:hypothetical protein Ahy_B08g090656 isoform B [Arachis hypogaea]|uniref:DCD domain-containing protein n=2 Tax=Arachis hypogaea TaxID=3818 RepID=A0A444Y0D3_ARAHY|nr:hypothetical protein Ahy_B08g090656 isoform B [Arachis hypogaea]